MRIGVYGGSFDPIHRGHVAVAAAVREARALPEVALVPAARPPHKAGCVAPFADRVAMARLAVHESKGLVVWDVEGEREGPSYTIDTIRGLPPELEPELLVGADMLADLPAWREAEALVGRVVVVAFARPGEDLGAAAAAFRAAFPGRAPVLVEVPAVPASGTAIRAALAAGRDPGPGLDPRISAYIRDRGLYVSG